MSVTRRLLGIASLLLVMSYGITAQHSETPYGQITQLQIDAYLECALSDDATVLQACECEVNMGDFCRCGTCCDALAHDACTKLEIYDRPAGYPICTDYCGYYYLVCVDCGCRRSHT